MSPNFYQKSEVLYKLGMIYSKTNQIDQAISYFQNSILTNIFTIKRKIDTLLKIGILYEEQNEYGQALRSYEAALSHEENNYKAYQHIAWANFNQENIPNAIEATQKAEKKNKGAPDTLYIIGRCRMSQQNYDEALRCYEEACSKNQKEAVYCCSLGIVYYLKSKCKEAFDQFIKASNLNANIPEIWYNLGILYEQCQQPKEALFVYNKVIEQGSTYNEA